MNYQQLVDLSIAYADRYDLEVANNIDMFIILMEARVNRLLKTREQSARAYTATQDGAEYYNLPPDYAGMRDIQLNSDLPTTDHSSEPMRLISPELFNEQRNKPYCGITYYTVIANQLNIHPVQDAGKTIEMVYYQKVPNLNQSVPNNWMSDGHPDIYVAGMTAEIELFAKNYESADGWFERMRIAVDELDTADVKERWSGSSLVTKLA